MINVILVLFVVIGFIISVPTGLLVLIMCLCFLCYMYYQKRSLNQSLEKITKQIDDILYHHKQFYIYQYKEGSLYILENEIKKLVLKLSDQNRQLKQERNLLKESLEDISHQMKTPLTSLNLIIERLKDSNISLKEKKVLIKEEVKLLDKIEWLIQSLLKLAQIDSHSIEFVQENIKTEEFIHQLIEPFEILIDIKDISVDYQYQKDSVLYIDKHWTLEALSNIVKNCIEHLKEEGKLKIEVNQTPLYDEVIIQDNGEGIDPEDLLHLFERFYKGKNSSHQSVGIGLALSQKIIENQNGTISVENTYPGAKFTIHFYKEVV